jgi:cell wall-associated NlpC family hydrolase
MKAHKVLHLFLFACLLASCSPSRHSTQRRGYNSIERNREKIIAFAYQQIGTPYQYGGSTPHGFDCSGFVQYVFRKAGYSLPHSTIDQSQTGKKVRKQDLRPGDLVFFTGSNKRRSKAGHVGIVVEKYRNNSFLFIHAASRGVTENRSEETYWRERYLNARRVLPSGY